MRVLVTGWNGLLGSALVPLLRARHEVDGFGVQDGDLGDREFLSGRMDAFRPDAVVHLAAYTAVDDSESRPEEAFRVNEEGSRRVAEEAERVGAAVVALSTDYVFDGRGRRPYREEDPPHPLTVYGRSKLAGEAAVQKHPRHAIVRSAWLYGPGGRNFVTTILAALDARPDVRVVTDQIGSPTFTVDLAQGLVRLVERGALGLYHLVNEGEASWFDLAREAARLRGISPDRVKPATTAEVPRPAPRPPYSVLDASKAASVLGYRPRPWREALADYLGTP